MYRVAPALIATLGGLFFVVQAVGQSAISTEGVIESKSGGFKFPDGTVQLSADSPIVASQCNFTDEFAVGLDSNGQIVCQSIFFSEIESIYIDSFPYADSGDTSLSTEDGFVYYSCAQSKFNVAPENIYNFYTTTYGSLTVSLVDGPSVDNDIYLLSSPNANSCLATHGNSLSYNVNAGERYWIAIDPFCNPSGECLSGAYDLSIDLVQP